MQVLVQRPARRVSGDGGAALLETALLTPIFFYVLCAIAEFGRGFFVYQASSNAAQAAARGVSIAHSNSLADYTTLEALQTNGRALDYRQLNYLVVWHASSATSDITVDAPGCAAGTPNGHTLTPAEKPPTVVLPASTVNFCNVYRQSVLSDLVASKPLFGCANTTTSPDRHWCPNDRNTNNSNVSAIGTPQRPADYAGIYLSYDLKFMTGLFGTGRTLTTQSIARLEPQAV